LKVKAKKLGLWNMFLPKNHFKEGAGFTNLEYGLMAEHLGKSRVASEVGSLASVLGFIYVVFFLSGLDFGRAL
jgi:acyl-CoA dehydrogenase